MAIMVFIFTPTLTLKHWIYVLQTARHHSNTDLEVTLHWGSRCCSWPDLTTSLLLLVTELWLELSRESWSLWWWSTIKPPTSWLDLMLMLLLRLHWLALGRSNIMQTELAENQSCIYKYNAITVLDCALNRIPPHPDRYQNQDCFRYLYYGYTATPPRKSGNIAYITCH